MRTLFVFLIALFCLIGCGSSGSFHGVQGAEAVRPAYVMFHMDTTFTPEERAVFQKASETWREQTSGLARIDLVYDLDFDSVLGLQDHVRHKHNLIIRLLDDSELTVDADEAARGEVLGWMTAGGIHNPGHQPIRGAFVVDRMLPAEKGTLVALHEFGHALGMPHSDSIQSTMYPAIVYGQKACLKKADLVSFCTVNECGSAKLYPCE